MKKPLIVVLGLCMAALATPASAQTKPDPAARDNVTLYSFRYRDAPLSMVLENLKSMTGKNVVVDPGITASVTAFTPDKLTVEEALAFITQTLEAQGILLENQDEKTIRVRGAPDRVGGPENAGGGYAARRLARIKVQQENAPPPDAGGEAPGAAPAP